MKNNNERKTGELFGNLWTSLSDDQWTDSVKLFTKRAIANQFDLKWLKDKKCLDAGCGSGRYSVALALHGASSITAIDISESGLKEAKRRAAEFSQISFQQASVLDLPFDDATFDFVWSAGVIHHTVDFDKALSELTRVLRPGGKLFLLVYGSGGLRWKAIKAMRPIVIDLGYEFIDKAIDDSGLPANNRKHFMDDLFVPVQKLTSLKELQENLMSLGFKNIDRWTGETYDHESNPATQQEDIEKLNRIAMSCVNIAKTPLERCLANLLREITNLFLETVHNVANLQALSPNEIHEIVLGETNLRIVATK